jgi:serine/threonine protein kinase
MSQAGLLTEGALINDRYRVIGLIGGGAMARVYRVEHVELGTIHALKEQTGGDDSGSEASIEAALREARFLSKLSHPGIPRVTDFFREGGNVYFVMDYIDGQNLKSIIDRNESRALDIPTVLRWGIQICDVLIYLHSQNPPIIFRDIKPSNLIRRPDGTVNLVDFGIARRVRQGAATDTVLFGSPGYAPPEQYGQGQTTPRSDIYALGATLHHLMTGRDPSSEPFKWPSLYSLNPAVPLVLDRLVMKCLEMKPANRIESAEALRTGLRFSLQFIEEGTGASAVKKLIGFGSDTGDLSPEMLLRGPDTAPHNTAEMTVPERRHIPPVVMGSVSVETNAPRPVARRAAQPVPILQQTVDSGRSGLNQLLFSILLFAAVPIFTLNVVYLPAAVIQYVMPNSQTSAPVRLTGESEREFVLRKTDFEKQVRARRLLPVKALLDVLVGVLLFFGVVRPMRPTTAGMIAAAGGILALIILTGMLLLPDYPGLYGLFAIIELGLLVPTVQLITSEGR